MISIRNYLCVAALWVTTTIMVLLPQPVCGYLNIFINQQEMMKLMGLDAELFYVRNGVVNSYAMIFVVPVPADIYDLEFTWQSLTEYPLRYRVTIEYESELGGLLSPNLSIPIQGYIPIILETFTIHLPCTGNVSEAVPVGINLVIEGSPNFNNTHMMFKRNKICIKGQYPNSPAPALAPDQGPALLGAAACALGLALIVGLIASAMYMRARKQFRQDSLNTSYTTSVYGSHQNVFVRLDPLGRPPSVNSGSYATIASLNKFPLTESFSKKSWFRTTSPTPSPYATANLLPVQNGGGCNNNHHHQHLMAAETVYAKPESVCPSHVSYYASSQLTQVYGGVGGLSTPPPIPRTPHSMHTNKSNGSNVTFSGRLRKEQYQKNTNSGSGGGGGGGGYEAKDKWRRLEVSPEAIDCLQLVREGTYGRIYSGTVTVKGCNNNSATKHQQQLIINNNYNNDNEECVETRKVLIKTVLDGASLTLTQVAFLLSEGALFAGLSHANIHSPVAVSLTVPGSPAPKIAYPLATGGNLKTYLQGCRDNNNGAPSTRLLVHYGLQLAKAVSYIHSLGILHRDIATRNCVIDPEEQVVRLGDSALARDLFPDDYYCLGDNENRPVKWLALETLQKKLTLVEGDCWSFGVLLWELVTLAGMPYEEVDCFELEGFLGDGYRLEQPVNCPDEFYTVMTCCWLEDHAQRPSFAQLIAYLQDFHEDLSKYI